MRCRQLKRVSGRPIPLPHRFILLLVIPLSLLPMDCVRADTVVRIVETWPPGDHVTLGKNQHFYLRLAYETDKPVHIWARPYFNGKPANAGSNPSPIYSGKGETYGWFFFQRPGIVVDEVRITAGDGSVSNTPVVAVWRGDIVGGSEVGEKEAQPAWIAEMSARVKAAEDETYRARMQEQKPRSRVDTVLLAGFGLAVLACGLFGLFMPVWAVWRWHGGWRMAAAVPAAMMGFVIIRIVVDGLRDPTSHNLWPFEILMAGSLSLGMMTLLYLAHKLVSRKR